jgi:hypothetical protein
MLEIAVHESIRVETALDAAPSEKQKRFGPVNSRVTRARRVYMSFGHARCSHGAHTSFTTPWRLDLSPSA